MMNARSPEASIKLVIGGLLLIVREVLYGLHQFNEIRASLGISRAVLSERLKELKQNDILERRSDAQDKRAAQYHLTAKGRDLWPVIIALLDWSNKHVLGETEDIVYPLNPDSNKPIADLCARDIDGNVTPLKKMVLRKGKTASQHLGAHYKGVSALVFCFNLKEVSGLSSD